MDLYLKFRKVLSLLFVSKLHRNTICLKLTEPVVSFTFDDIPKSAFTNGESILKKYNYSGTYYISGEFMRENGFDFDDADSGMMQQIVAGGGELACHTYSHLHFYKSKPEEIISDLARNQRFIEKFVGSYKLENFSYPYGEQTPFSRAIIRQRYRTGRSTYKGINYGRIDLNCLKCIRLYEMTPQSDLISIIDTVIRNKGWLIFYTHEIEENPPREGCTPNHFEAVVRHCYEKKLKVLPVNRVLDLIES